MKFFYLILVFLSLPYSFALILLYLLVSFTYRSVPYYNYVGSYSQFILVLANDQCIFVSIMFVSLIQSVLSTTLQSCPFAFFFLFESKAFVSFVSIFLFIYYAFWIYIIQFCTIEVDLWFVLCLFALFCVLHTFDHILGFCSLYKTMPNCLSLFKRFLESTFCKMNRKLRGGIFLQSWGGGEG